MISLRNIVVEYTREGKSTRAVDDVTLDIAPGTIQGIVGFSGAGKSTLLRTINLLERPNQGQVLVAGQDLMELDAKALREARHDIGMIFQHFNLVANLTVLKNVELSLKFAGIPASHRQQRALEALDIVDLADKARAYPGQLSGGQKQRVAIARALATRPSVLLCDEPTSAVDPRTTTSILQYLKNINADLGITTVIVTHEMNVIRALADDVAVLEGGRLVERFTTEKLADPTFTPHSDIGRLLRNDDIVLHSPTHVGSEEKVLIHA
ncbi:methionine ABC transporter ATP-binding protein [Rothia nasimurium]|uniref:methionine ABC transporter ATP-binding protein n=1 Tax=Rothia nasimurium TaxID=85336 RepID=UPI003BA23055